MLYGSDCVFGWGCAIIRRGKDLKDLKDVKDIKDINDQCAGFDWFPNRNLGTRRKLVMGLMDLMDMKDLKNFC